MFGCNDRIGPGETIPQIILFGSGSNVRMRLSQCCPSKLEGRKRTTENVPVLSVPQPNTPLVIRDHGGIGGDCVENKLISSSISSNPLGIPGHQISPQGVAIPAGERTEEPPSISLTPSRTTTQEPLEEELQREKRQCQQVLRTSRTPPTLTQAKKVITIIMEV